MTFILTILGKVISTLKLLSFIFYYLWWLRLTVYLTQPKIPPEGNLNKEFSRWPVTMSAEVYLQYIHCGGKAPVHCERKNFCLQGTWKGGKSELNFNIQELINQLLSAPDYGHCMTGCSMFYLPQFLYNSGLQSRTVGRKNAFYLKFFRVFSHSNRKKKT